MNIGLWIVQGLLAALYLMAGGWKTFQTAQAKEKMEPMRNYSDGMVRFIGISEMLGALGLILPLVTGILPWLTVLAAIGLTVIQVLAIFTVHLPRKEFNGLPMNALLLTLSAFITFGRWDLFV